MALFQESSYLGRHTLLCLTVMAKLDIAQIKVKIADLISYMSIQLILFTNQIFNL